MFTAIVLICSLAVGPLPDCTVDNAEVVIQVPETFSNPVTCVMHGQAYLAGTSLGVLEEDEAVKVVCIKGATPWQ
jgi:hypothetical protein